MPTVINYAFRLSKKSAIREIHDRFVQLVKNHLDEAVEEGDIPPIDTEVVAYAWMGAINEVVIRWVYSEEPEPKRSLPALRTLLLRSIGASDEQIHQIDDKIL